MTFLSYESSFSNPVELYKLKSETLPFLLSDPTQFGAILLDLFFSFCKKLYLLLIK